MTIVFDSGAILAAERNDWQFRTFMAVARRQDARMVVPSSVVAETWRGSSTHPLAARFLNLIHDFPALAVRVARRLGSLLAHSATTAIVDAHVAEAAIAARPSTVVTSDPIDIQRLLHGSGIRQAIFGSQTSTTEVIIFPI